MTRSDAWLNDKIAESDFAPEIQLSMQRIAMIGSTQMAARLTTYFETTGFASVVGCFDDFEPRGAIKHDQPILGACKEVPALYKKGAFDAVAMAVGFKQRKFRKDAFLAVKREGVPVATFVHPSCHVEPSVKIGEGCIVLVRSVLDLNVVLEENVLISSASFLSHDVRIGAHSYCSPSLNIAGHTQIGECCFMGIDTTTITDIRIGKNVVTAAGSVITKNVPDDVLVAGAPAEVKRLPPAYRMV